MILPNHTPMLLLGEEENKTILNLLKLPMLYNAFIPVTKIQIT